MSLSRKQRSQALLDALRREGVPAEQARAVLATMSRAEPGRWLPVDALDLVASHPDGIYFSAAVANYLRHAASPSDPAAPAWLHHELRRLAWVMVRPVEPGHS